MRVYILQHAYGSDDAEEVKLIGVYRSERDAEQARIRAATLPGFSDHVEGFSVDAYELGRDEWTDGFVAGSHEGAKSRGTERAA